MKTQRVSAWASSWRSSSRTNRYRRGVERWVNSGTHVWAAMRSPANAGRRYSTKCDRTTQPAPISLYRAIGQPTAAECSMATSCIHAT
jgi:hypothetical protein